MAEYEAYILGLEATLEVGAVEVDVFGDSTLLIDQIKGEWQIRDEKLASYHEHLMILCGRFKKCNFIYLPRDKNQFANALATLAAMIEIPKDNTICPLLIEQRQEPVYCFFTKVEYEEFEREPLYRDVIEEVDC